ncbi:hypothetical protein [Trichocoleus sp. FACHB-262]|uniref:hypothetical protein n=1 Tax=Trichocoleus sp. FACHB-262 TaxID=2692869 RepID=UPI001F54D440|nr:hypothetical protein [Trichocoleus sp. FACHB-262]
MIDPIFWLGLSILLVAVSLAAVLVVAIPALQELARAARSAEKLFDTLSRELPPTLESIRLTGLEISDLTDDMSEGVKSAGQVVKQVDQSFDGARKQVQKAQTTTRSVFAGMKAAWRTFSRTPTSVAGGRRSMGRLPPPSRSPLDVPSGSYNARSTSDALSELGEVSRPASPLEERPSTLESDRLREETRLQNTNHNYPPRRELPESTWPQAESAESEEKSVEW